MDNNLDNTLKKYLKYAKKKRFPKDQILLYKDDKPLDVFILTHGIVKLYEDENGSTKILHIFKPTAVLPLAFFSGSNETLNWYYGAVTNCEICVIPYSKFNSLLEKNFEDYEVLTNWFSVEVHEILVRLSSIAKTKSNHKLIAALKFLSVHHSKKLKDGWLQIIFPINHQLLADLTGLSRERIALMMKRLSIAKVIRNPKQNTLEINWAKLSKRQ